MAVVGHVSPIARSKTVFSVYALASPQILRTAKNVAQQGFREAFYHQPSVNLEETNPYTLCIRIQRTDRNGHSRI